MPASTAARGASRILGCIAFWALRLAKALAILESPFCAAETARVRDEHPGTRPRRPGMALRCLGPDRAPPPNPDRLAYQPWMAEQGVRPSRGRLEAVFHEAAQGAEAVGVPAFVEQEFTRGSFSEGHGQAATSPGRPTGISTDSGKGGPMENPQVTSLTAERRSVATESARPAVHRPLAASAPKPKLLDRVRQAIRARHLSRNTEQAYVAWIKRFILFHGKRHPAEMGEAEIGQFLSSLACEFHVSASTQNQALNAVLFLYREVLERKIGLIQGVVRAKRPRRLPVILTKEEVTCLLGGLRGTPWSDRIDRVKAYTFRITQPDYVKLFDGSEQLVGISAFAWYVRQVFVR